jgi:PKD repeat protein
MRFRCLIGIFTALADDSRAVAKLRKRRGLAFQRLETRRLMVAEGSLFSISQTFDNTGLSGDLSASVRWGDGTQSVAAVQGSSPTSKLKVKFDYSLDSAGFFSAASRRTLLSSAVDAVLGQLTDELAAIRPSGSNSWTATTLHPETGRSVSFNNLLIGTNEILVFVGSRNLGPNQLGIGGPGGFQASGSQAWLNTVAARGQTGALGPRPTDFGPWGGMMSFSSTANWYFGIDPKAIGANQSDFLSVASHEFMHVLGFGTSGSWNGLVSGDRFTGAKASAEYDFIGYPPLSPDRGHWAQTVTDGGRGGIMTPILSTGTRDLVTPLDMAALDDIGWQRATSNIVVTASHTFADNGNFPVDVILRASKVGEITRSLSASITNVAPTLTLAADQQVVAGQRISISDLGRISDPGFANPAASPPTAETFTYTINWGDGGAIDSGAATILRMGKAGVTTLASFNGSHVYESPGTYNVVVTAKDDDGGTTSRTLRVVVAARPQLALALARREIAENGGDSATLLTITRPQSASASAVTIELASSDTKAATVPASVMIPAGQTFVVVPVTAVDNDLLEGTKSVTLTATAAGYAPAAIGLTVTDHETIRAEFSDDVIREDAAPGSTTLTLSRSNTNTSLPLVVTVSGNAPRRISLPTSIVIPAGSNQVRIAVDPIDDNIAQAPLTLDYRFTAAGYVADERSLKVLDDEPPRFQNRTNQFDVDGNDSVSGLDAILIVNYLSRIRNGGSPNLDPDNDLTNGLFLDVNGDYQVTALDVMLVINEMSRRRLLGS